MATQQHREATRTETGRDIVLRQALFREVNERMARLAEPLDAAIADERCFVCECGNAGCAEQLELTQAEYEIVRRYPTHFVVKPGHENRAVERVVETAPGYSVVEKFGEGGFAAVRLDPRRRGARDGRTA